MTTLLNTPFAIVGRAVLRKGWRQRLSPDDVLLLKAALLDGDAAVAAYETWRPNLHCATFSAAQKRLLPLLQQNLTRLGIGDPQVERFRRLRQSYGVRNLKSIRAARPVFAALDRRGVPFIVLKGAALVAQYVSDLTLRPMSDIDILVPKERLADAVEVLAAMNLMPGGMSPSQLLANGRLQASLPGWPFFGPDKQEIDLHWKLLHLDRRSQADDGFWQACHEVSLMGARVRVLDPAHQLLHICAHGAQPVAGAALQQWPADAALIIRGAADLSYDRLVDEAARHALSAVMADKLAFLADEFALPIPRSAIVRLRSASGWVECAEMRLLATRSGPLLRPLLRFQDFRRCEGNGLEQSIGTSISTLVQARAGTKSMGPAIIVAIQTMLGRPAWLRRLLGRDCYRDKPDPARLPRVGDTLNLLGAEVDEAALIGGWSWPESTGRWSMEKEATIAWSLAGKGGDLLLFVDGNALLHKKAPKQSVELWANDRLIARWRFRAGKPSPLPARLCLPRRLIGKFDVLLLTFLIRSPRSPAELGISTDARTLGIRLRSITLTHDDPRR